MIRILLLFGLLAPFAARGALDDGAQAAPAEIKRLHRALLDAIHADNGAAVRRAMRAIGMARGRRVCRMALDVARTQPPASAGVHWEMLAEFARLRDPTAFSEIGNYVVMHARTDFARDLVTALTSSGVRHKYLNRIVRRVLAKGPPDLQLAVLDLAAEVPVRRTVDVLLDFVAQRERDAKKLPDELSARIADALAVLTHADIGANLDNWRAWWEQNRAKGLAALRAEPRKRSPTTVALDPVRARQFAQERGGNGKVLVIRGPMEKLDVNFDHIEFVLERLGVPHEVIDKRRVADADFSFSGFAAVFVNCQQTGSFCQAPGHMGPPGGNACESPGQHDYAHFGWRCLDACGRNGCSAQHPALKKLKAFVDAGGMLFTEDWGYSEMLLPLWPQLVGRGRLLDASTVAIHPERGKGTARLLRGVFTPMPEEIADEEAPLVDPASEDDPEDRDDELTYVREDFLPGPSEEAETENIPQSWVIDQLSETIVPKSPEVEILIASDELEKKCGQRSVAITFPSGKGRVLHVLSHFGRQGSSRDEATIRNLLINWLLEIGRPR